MPSLTLKKIPDEVMERLRSLAEQERRSLNQQAILLLEQALAAQRPSFTEAHEAFVQKHGPPPFDDDFFEGLRSREMGRPSPFEDEEGR